MGEIVTVSTAAYCAERDWDNAKIAEDLAAQNVAEKFSGEVV
jgi:hypothetical protein